MCCFGQGVPLDYTEAVRWYRKAADQGYAKAEYNLGNMYSLWPSCNVRTTPRPIVGTIRPPITGTSTRGAF